MSRPSGLSAVFAVIGILFVANALAALEIPVAAESLGAGGRTLGALIAIPSVVGLAADVPVAALAGVYGRRTLIFGGAAAVVVAGVAGASGSMLGLVASAAFMGISVSCVFGPALALSIEAQSTLSQSSVQGTNGVIQAIGGLVGSVVGSLLSASPALEFGILACLGISLFLVASRLTTMSSNTRSAGTLKFVKGSYVRAAQLLRRRPALQLAALITMTYTLLWVVIGGSFIPLFLLTERQYSGSEVAGVLAVRNLLAAGSSLVFSRAEAIVGRRFLTLLPLGFAIGATALLPSLPLRGLAPALIASSGLGLGFAVPAANLLIGEGTGTNERVVGVSTVTMSSRFIALISPLILGVSLDIGGFGALFAIGSALGAGLLASVWLRRVVREPASDRSDSA